MIASGKYPAKAVGQVVLGTSSQKKTPYIELYFRIENGSDGPIEVRWTGYLGPNSAERTIESLQFCGWQGDDLGEFADRGLHGLDTNEIQAVVEHEEYQTDAGETRVAPKVSWVNKLGGFLNVQNAMPADAAASFGEKMKGLVLKMKTKKGLPSDADTSFDHGANVGKQASGAKKGW